MTTVFDDVDITEATTFQTYAISMRVLFTLLKFVYFLLVNHTDITKTNHINTTIVGASGFQGQLMWGGLYWNDWSGVVVVVWRWEEGAESGGERSSWWWWCF